MYIYIYIYLYICIYIYINMDFVDAIIIIMHIKKDRLLDRGGFYPKRSNAQIFVKAFAKTSKLLSGARARQGCAASLCGDVRKRCS